MTPIVAAVFICALIPVAIVFELVCTKHGLHLATVPTATVLFLPRCLTSSAASLCCTKVAAGQDMCLS